MNNDIPGNTFHAIAQPIVDTTSGFGAPIGGYQFSPLAPSPSPTAVPLWVTLRNAGKSVVTATWPGGDGVNVILFGTPGTPVAQPSSVRTVNYTVPFGAFGGLGAEGLGPRGPRSRATARGSGGRATVTSRILWRPGQESNLRPAA